MAVDGALSAVAGIVSDMAVARSEMQAVQLGLALNLGVVLGLWYDMYRVWFRHCRGRIWRGVGDILWWVAALGLSVVALYHINGVELRLPVLLLVVAGLCLYMGLLSPVLFPVLQDMVRLVWRFVLWVVGRVWHIGGLVVRFVVLPVVWVVDVVVWFWGVCRGVFGVPVGFIYKVAYRVVYGVLGGICGKFIGRFFSRVINGVKCWLGRVGWQGRAVGESDKKAAKEVDFSEENDI